MHKPAPFKLYIEAARPKTLIAGIAPVVLATALCSLNSAMSWLIAFSALIFALSIQIATNYFNDAYDWKRGADTPSRKGPRRLVSAKLISFNSMRRAGFICLAVAAMCSLVLIYRAGFLLMAPLCLLAGILAFAYTAGPKPLAYLGLGDIAVWIFFGPLATSGVYYLIQLEFSPVAAAVGAICGFLSCQLLAINNTRDIEEDRSAGKKTLPVRLGIKFGKVQIMVCSLAPCLILMGLYIFVKTAPLFLLSAALLIAVSAWQYQKLFTSRLRDFRPLFKVCTLTLWAVMLFTSLGIIWA